MTLWSQCSRCTTLGLLAAIVHMTDVVAAEIKVMTPRSMWTVLKEIGPAFERQSHHTLNVHHDIAANLADRIIKSERFDVFVGPPVQIERLIKSNNIITSTRTAIAHSGIGVEVRAGAPKPDISTVDAFKRTLLNAKSIGYLKQAGTSGAYLHGLFERLGIAEAIKSKVVRPETDIVSELVAKGEIELGMVVITQIMTTPGVELVGPIPKEVQSYVRWIGGVSTSSAAPDVAMNLLRFLTGPTALPVLKAQGMEPG